MKTVTSTSRLGARTGKCLAVALAALGVLHCGKKEAASGGKTPPKQAPAASEVIRPPAVTVADVVEKGSDAVNPDGTVFKPAKVFVGDRSGAPYEIDAGQVTVRGGKLTIHIGPMAGHDAVYDFVRLVTADGRETRVEAEDPASTTGDRFSDNEGAEGHWWLQPYTAFSKGKGLVARKNKKVPVVTTVIRVPDGTYRLFIASFKGDEAFGVYALGVTWE